MSDNLGAFEILPEHELTVIAQVLSEKAAQLKLELSEIEKELEKTTSGLKAVMAKIAPPDAPLTINVPINGKTVLVTYIKPSTTKTFDSKAFKQEHPELAAKYTKTTEKPASIRISIAKDSSNKELIEVVADGEFI